MKSFWITISYKNVNLTWWLLQISFFKLILQLCFYVKKKLIGSVREDNQHEDTILSGVFVVFYTYYIFSRSPAIAYKNVHETNLTRQVVGLKHRSLARSLFGSIIRICPILTWYFGAYRKLFSSHVFRFLYVDNMNLILLPYEHTGFDVFLYVIIFITM